MTESTIPLLLAGPIIRRVDKTQVCIWIATSKAVYTKIEIFKFKKSNSDFVSSKDVNKKINEELGPHLSQSDMHIMGSGNGTSLKLGDNLYVSLIIARPFPLNEPIEPIEPNRPNLLSTFPMDEILAYDMELSLSNEGKEKGLRLKDLDLLSGENTILYDSCDSGELHNYNDPEHKPLPCLFSLPTFYIPVGENGPQSNFLYGSCRKLHGNDEDSLIMGDKLLASSISDLKKRPSSLFLIGDQIYADDVAGPLIGHLDELANELLGWREVVDGLDKNLEDIPVGGRRQLVRSKAHFTSEVSDNHLLGFGEFAVMYLIAWNSLLWPKKFDHYLANFQHSSVSKKQYEAELRGLEISRKNLQKIRRLLANVPTYMICDDHEITDDWNIDRKWRDSVRNSKSGSQIIVNGLVAYWAFQAWGNDPDSFDKDFIQTIKTYLELKKQNSLFHFDKTSKISNLDNDSGDSKIDKTQIMEDVIWNYQKWTYVAPTYPLSIFLDCRTQREFVNPDGPPVLLNDEALAYIKSEVYNSGYEQGDPLVIISPTPVFGFELAESVQRFLTSISGTYKWDLETWRANETGFIRFLAFVSNTFSPDYCVILSGDVHYSFTMKARFDLFAAGCHHLKGSAFDWSDDIKILSSLPIAQLTASPIRSNSLSKRKLAIMILNIVHKILMTKKMVSRTGFIDANYESSLNNNGATKKLREEKGSKEKNSLRFKLLSKENTNYSKHGKDVSFLIKIKTIFLSLFSRYLANRQRGSVERLPDWREFRLLVAPKGHGTTPVLTNNNMGLVSLNLKKRTIEHTLFFLESNKIRSSVAVIDLDDTKKDTI
jgi:hypothetical protein